MHTRTLSDNSVLLGWPVQCRQRHETGKMIAGPLWQGSGPHMINITGTCSSSPMPLCFQRNLMAFAKACPTQMTFITTSMRFVHPLWSVSLADIHVVHHLSTTISYSHMQSQGWGFLLWELAGSTLYTCTCTLYIMHTFSACRCLWPRPVSIGWLESTVHLFLRFPQMCWGRLPRLFLTRYVHLYAWQFPASVNNRNYKHNMYTCMCSGKHLREKIVYLWEVSENLWNICWISCIGGWGMPKFCAEKTQWWL